MTTESLALKVLQRRPILFSEIEPLLQQLMDQADCATAGNG